MILPYLVLVVLVVSLSWAVLLSLADYEYRSRFWLRTTKDISMRQIATRAREVAHRLGERVSDIPSHIVYADLEIEISLYWEQIIVRVDDLKMFDVSWRDDRREPKVDIFRFGEWIDHLNAIWATLPRKRREEG